MVLRWRYDGVMVVMTVMTLWSYMVMVVLWRQSGLIAQSGSRGDGAIAIDLCLALLDEE